LLHLRRFFFFGEFVVFVFVYIFDFWIYGCHGVLWDDVFDFSDDIVIGGFIVRSWSFVLFLFPARIFFFLGRSFGWCFFSCLPLCVFCEFFIEGDVVLFFVFYIFIEIRFFWIYCPYGLAEWGVSVFCFFVFLFGCSCARMDRRFGVFVGWFCLLSVLNTLFANWCPLMDVEARRHMIYVKMI
jgi:hypothetical protein